MSPKVTLEIAELQDKTVHQLVQRYEQVFKEECRSRNKQYLVRRIAWRLQANDEGGFSRAALKKAEELAVDANIRVTAPRKYSSDGVKLVHPEPDSFVDWDPRLPPPGNIVERQHKGKMIRVIVLKDGFEYEGRRYKSLTAIAKEVSVQIYRICSLWSSIIFSKPAQTSSVSMFPRLLNTTVVTSSVRSR